MIHNYTALMFVLLYPRIQRDGLLRSVNNITSCDSSFTTVIMTPEPNTFHMLLRLTT